MLNQKGIKLSTNIPNDLYINADKQMIQTAFRNILTNAAKYTENGKIAINSKTNNNKVEIEIRDTGVGIPKDKLDNLFEIVKLKSTLGTKGEQGTGLGLIICKEFIKVNKGTINVKSEKGKGTCFIVTLPGIN